MTAPTVERLAQLCDAVLDAVRDGPLAAEVEAIRLRLDGPLRVAIAGQVKAGKSTLLNALVAERLAPTDAGECTRVVTWYHEGLGYDVRAVLTGGAEQELQHRRDNGALQIDLGELTAEEIDHLDVAWASSALRRHTLIDTPGLGSLDDSKSVRTRDFLGVEGDHPSDADAVIYLLRHLHRHDADFLEAFMDRSLSNASPANTVAVLSRADEVGAGRLDALESAGRIATRYAGDERLRALCLTVVPVAALVAETGLTLEEAEGAALRSVAELPDDSLDRMLLSADLFSSFEPAPISSDVRRRLLQRLGMFGVRQSVDWFRSGKITTSAELARRLVETSGLHTLQAVLEEHFLPRAKALKARSALTALRSVARDLAASSPDQAEDLSRRIEEVEASAHEFAELRLVHLVWSGSIDLSVEETDEVGRVTGGGGPAEKVGRDREAPLDELQAVALAAVERWRTRAANPMAEPEYVDACEIMARSYEGIYAAVSSGDSGRHSPE